MSDEFIYDAVPYPSYVFPQTHPDRLATLAVLHGISAAKPGQCRVLELGCGDGTNLLAQAYALPSSKFVGIDLSQTHIDDAIRTANDLDITNAVFSQMDVTSVDTDELGEFDFIIAHGLFSWVPDVVRPAILKIYSECLSPRGIGYISYNALPGCHIRQITHDMMRFHTRGIDDPASKVESGISMLDLMTASADTDSIYQATLALEAEQIKERSIGNVFHDDLSEFNRPFYFHEFCSLIDAYGLTYLCESEPSNVLDKGLSATAIDTLNKLSGSVIEREQYRDFITARRFRSTLICKSDVSIDRNFTPNAVSSFFIASHVGHEADAAALVDDSEVRFSTPKGNRLTVNHPLTKLVLAELGAKWTRSYSIDELLDQIAGRYSGVDSSDGSIAILCNYLLQMYFAGFVKLHLYQPRFVTEISKYPVVSSFARWQIEHGGRSVTTMTGTNLEPEYDSIRELIFLLDGRHDRAAIVAKFKQMLEGQASGQIPDQSEIGEMVDANLATIASAGLLIA